MPSHEFSVWRDKIISTGDMAPLSFGSDHEQVIRLFGEPDDTSVKRKHGKPVILKYQDIEFHFDFRKTHYLALVWSDDAEGNVKVCVKE